MKTIIGDNHTIICREVQAVRYWPSPAGGSWTLAIHFAGTHRQESIFCHEHTVQEICELLISYAVLTIDLPTHRGAELVVSGEVA